MNNPDNASLYKDTEREQKIRRREIFPDEYADTLPAETGTRAEEKREKCSSMHLG